MENTVQLMNLYEKAVQYYSAVNDYRYQIYMRKTKKLFNNMSDKDLGFKNIEEKKGSKEEKKKKGKKGKKKKAKNKEKEDKKEEKEIKGDNNKKDKEENDIKNEIEIEEKNEIIEDIKENKTEK